MHPRLLYTKTSRSSSAINPQERRLRAVISELPTWKACSKTIFFLHVNFTGQNLAIIHRLDQPVEGILVFAKTPAAAKELNRQLTSQEFGKYYLAVISGIPEPQEGSLENYLVKDTRTNSSAVCTKTTPGAKLARLHYRTIETYGAPGNEKFTDSKSTDTPKHTSRNHRQPPLQNESSALIEIHLDTGRHHQIRVQMAYFGHPLIGDRKYGKEITDHMNSVQSSTKRFQAGQLHLCAYKLTFHHPKTGKEMEFQI